MPPKASGDKKSDEPALSPAADSSASPAQSADIRPKAAPRGKASARVPARTKSWPTPDWEGESPPSSLSRMTSATTIPDDPSAPPVGAAAIPSTPTQSPPQRRRGPPPSPSSTEPTSKLARCNTVEGYKSIVERCRSRFRWGPLKIKYKDGGKFVGIHDSATMEELHFLAAKAYFRPPDSVRLFQKVARTDALLFGHPDMPVDPKGKYVLVDVPGFENVPSLTRLRAEVASRGIPEPEPSPARRRVVCDLPKTGVMPGPGAIVEVQLLKPIFTKTINEAIVPPVRTTGKKKQQVGCVCGLRFAAKGTTFSYMIIAILRTDPRQLVVLPRGSVGSGDVTRAVTKKQAVLSGVDPICSTKEIQEAETTKAIDALWKEHGEKDVLFGFFGNPVAKAKPTCSAKKAVRSLFGKSAMNSDDDASASDSGSETSEQTSGESGASSSVEKNSRCASPSASSTHTSSKNSSSSTSSASSKSSEKSAKAHEKSKKSRKTKQKSSESDVASAAVPTGAWRKIMNERKKAAETVTATQETTRDAGGSDDASGAAPMKDKKDDQEASEPEPKPEIKPKQTGKKASSAVRKKTTQRPAAKKSATKKKKPSVSTSSSPESDAADAASKSKPRPFVNPNLEADIASDAPPDMTIYLGGDKMKLTHVHPLGIVVDSRVHQAFHKTTESWDADLMHVLGIAGMMLKARRRPVRLMYWGHTMPSCFSSAAKFEGVTLMLVSFRMHYSVIKIDTDTRNRDFLEHYDSAVGTGLHNEKKIRQWLIQTLEYPVPANIPYYSIDIEQQRPGVDCGPAAISVIWCLLAGVPVGTYVADFIEKIGKPGLQAFLRERASHLNLAAKHLYVQWREFLTKVYCALPQEDVTPTLSHFISEPLWSPDEPINNVESSAGPSPPPF